MHSPSARCRRPASMPQIGTAAVHMHLTSLSLHAAMLRPRGAGCAGCDLRRGGLTRPAPPDTLGRFGCGPDTRVGLRASSHSVLWTAGPQSACTGIVSRPGFPPSKACCSYCGLARPQPIPSTLASILARVCPACLMILRTRLLRSPFPIA